MEERATGFIKHTDIVDECSLSLKHHYRTRKGGYLIKTPVLWE